ncbi:MAG TPA: hypothetical protein VNT02_00280 [Burkholderiales bacterium]|nr:hypothetical protein [Burkholderiales bacterium]
MLLVRDVLDKQLVDKTGRKMGRVDGILMTVHKDEPPEVRAIELGSVVLARRVHPRVGSWMARLARRLRLNGVYRISWRRIAVGKDIRADILGERTRALKLERWLRDRVIARIPGG